MSKAIRGGDSEETEPDSSAENGDEKVGTILLYLITI